MRVESNTTVLLTGPGKLESDEYADVFGAKVKEVTVPEGKIYPIFFSTEAEVKVEGTYFLVNGDTIPESWKKFVEKGYDRVFTFGDTDSGKSSFCVYAMNAGGIDCALDADVGQSDIAHPGAMGLGVRKGQITSLTELAVKEIAFTGVISPAGFEARCLRAFRYLVKLAGEKIIVDTTGWVRGRKARDYKLAKIEILEPDVVACFGEAPYYLQDYNVLRLDSFVIKKRDREMRLIIRGRKYEEWLKDAEPVEIHVDEVSLKNTAMFAGEPVIDDVLESFGEVIYAEKGFDFINIFSEKFDAGPEAVKFLREYFGVAEVNVVNPAELKGLLLGLRKEGRYVSPGLLQEIDFESRKIKILGKGDIGVIEFGNFRLDEDKREILVRVP